MSRRIKRHEAEQLAEDEHWQCRACSGPADESDVYCWHCRQYWNDCANGLWDDER